MQTIIFVKEIVEVYKSSIYRSDLNLHDFHLESFLIQYQLNEMTQILVEKKQM